MEVGNADMRASRLLDAVGGTRTGHREVTTIRFGGEREEGSAPKDGSNAEVARSAHAGRTDHGSGWV
jgi:hypothetical protein